MIGFSEILFVAIAIVSLSLIPLLYSVITRFLLFRKAEHKPSFFKHFLIYFGLFILASFTAGFLMRWIISTPWGAGLIFYTFFIDWSIRILIMTLLSSIWIKSFEKNPIGLMASFKISIITLFIVILTQYIMAYSFQYFIEKKAIQMPSLSPKDNYEKVMNLSFSSKIKNFKHLRGSEYGMFTNLEFTYSVPSSYFMMLEKNTHFIHQSEWNKQFHQVKCYQEQNFTQCYEGIIFPYVHKITYNTKTLFAEHSVSGMRD